MSSRGQTRGFTLVELLVVITIIGILMALSLVGIQSVRESARRAQCSSNLRELALAVAQFESARRVLPYNRYGDYGDWAKYEGPFENSLSWSWIASILPHIEMGHVVQDGKIPNSKLNESGVVDAVIPLLHCPSDDLASFSPFVENSLYMRGINVGLTNYKGVQGANFCWGDWANAAANGDCEPWEQGDGLFYPMNWRNPVRVTDVRDGMASTLMIGEDVWNHKRASCATPCYGLGFAWAHAVEANATAALPPNARRPNGDRYPEDDWTGQNGFHSNHPGGVVFAKGDASVHFLSDEIALGTYRAMATIAGDDHGLID